MIRWMPGIALAVAVLATAPAGAHHGWTSYDAAHTVTVTGTIREARFEHPHVTLRVQAQGQERLWVVVLPPPTRAARLGLTAESLRAGMTVTLAGHPHRSVADEMRALRITLGERTIPLR